MNRFFFLISIVQMLVLGCTRRPSLPATLPVIWEDSLQGDFSFSNAWSYPEGVYRNGFGQLSCDGICPPATEAMKDSTGRIRDESLSAFYRLVDTTHLPHTIASETNCDEWAGTDLVSIWHCHDTVYCQTLCNAATHCSLKLALIHHSCIPSVELISILPRRNTVYRCEKGTIRIDRAAWEKGILKAEFDFRFGNDPVAGKQIFWKGRIYRPAGTLSVDR